MTAETTAGQMTADEAQKLAEMLQGMSADVFEDAFLLRRYWKSEAMPLLMAEAQRRYHLEVEEEATR